MCVQDDSNPARAPFAYRAPRRVSSPDSSRASHDRIGEPLRQALDDLFGSPGGGEFDFTGVEGFYIDGYFGHIRQPALSQQAFKFAAERVFNARPRRR